MSGQGERAWTVLELLRVTADYFARQGLPTPRLDAECLLAAALGTDRLRLYLEFDKPVLLAERDRLRELVRQRARERVPVAQLTGTREFWSLPIGVTRDVLAPRPETETLVEAALECFPGREAELRVLDLGTGSGAVALALAHERPKARIWATDVSAEALTVATSNAERLGAGDRVRFLAGDLFEPVAGSRFDLVVSNPPYLAAGEAETLEPELAHEPPLALFAGADGLEVLLRIVAEAPQFLEPGGALLLEIDAAQAERVCQACLSRGLEEATVRRDLAGRPRVVVARAGEALR